MRVPLRRVGMIAAAVAVSALWGQNTRGEPSAQEMGAGQESAVAGLDAEQLKALTPLDRQILKLVNESQLDQLLDGTDPSDIYLSNGETLSEFSSGVQAESSRNLYFAAVRPCRLIDTRSSAAGYLLAGETRGFRVRAARGGYLAQGGAEKGCGLPGLEGVTLKTNTVRAIALNVLTLDVGGPGSLAIWPANQSEPEIGSVSFASALAGGGLTGGVLVPVCDEAGLDPCGAADLKIKAKMSGAHVVADVVGYFHAAAPRGGMAIAARSEPENRAANRVENTARPRGAEARAESRAPERRAEPRSALGARLEKTPAESETSPVDHMLPSEGASLLAPAGPGFEISLRGELATGHGAGAAVYGYIPNNLGVFNADAVKGHATTGNAVHGEAPNGRAVYGQTENGYAVYGFDGGSDANRGYAGFFYSTNGIGVYGYSGGNRAHPNILAPGVYGQSNQGVGVYGRGDTSNSYSFYNEGGYFVGGKGLYAQGTDIPGEQGYGARIFSSQYRGMYVQGASNYFDAYFGGDTGISTASIVDRFAATVALAVNLGTQAIQPGDLVALAGTAPSPENGRPMLGVAKLDGTNRSALIGVAKEAFTATTVKQPEGSEYTDFSPVSGGSAPQQYLTIVTRGLMPAVRLDSAPQLAGRRIGERVELAAGQVDAVKLGRVASDPDLIRGTIAVYIDID